MAAYYNENQPEMVAWLKALIVDGLIANGDVDERSIEDVDARDILGYRQAHFFAGTGGWSLALRMAGWPDERHAWTFSCPCQRFSSASRGRAVAADLWPAQRRLVVAGRPGVFFGEQVAAAGDWFDGLCADVEAVGYDVGAAILPAVAVGADHARPRILFVGDSDRHGESGRAVDAEASWVPRRRSDTGGVVLEDGVSARLAALSGFGNAIHVGLAAEFIAAYMEIAR
jgi:DNA (cytosine-5)-methyltransferase 1